MTPAKKVHISFSTLVLAAAFIFMAWLLYPEFVYHVQAASPPISTTPSPITTTTIAPSKEPTVSPDPSPSGDCSGRGCDGTGEPPQGTCNSADINEDGYVNNEDYDRIVTNFLITGPTAGRSDINRDGTVNLLDYSILAAQYGTETGDCK